MKSKRFNATPTCTTCSLVHTGERLGGRGGRGRCGGRGGRGRRGMLYESIEISIK